MPAELRPLFAAQAQAMHAWLFRESAAALQQVGAERRLLGAELGFVGVLHTWGRQLQHHPHVHYIVPGGGLSPDGKQWVPARQHDWLLPVARLAAGFARRMDEVVRAEAPALHAAIPAGTWRSRWSVHTQPNSPSAHVIRPARFASRPLAPNTKRIATSVAAAFLEAGLVQPASRFALRRIRTL